MRELQQGEGAGLALPDCLHLFLLSVHLVVSHSNGSLPGRTLTWGGNPLSAG